MSGAVARPSAVGLRVVCRRPEPIEAEDGGELTEDGSLKLRSAVSYDM